MALTEGDRLFLQAEFNRLHDRINKTDSRILHVKEEIDAKLAAHVEAKHNPAKTFGILASIMAFIVGLLELVKWFVKKG